MGPSPSEGGDDHHWFLDCVGKQHITPHRRYFNTYAEVAPYAHTLSSGDTITIIGSGFINISLQDGPIEYLAVMLHARQHTKNTFSMDACLHMGKAITFKTSMVLVSNTAGDTLFKGMPAAVGTGVWKLEYFTDIPKPQDMRICSNAVDTNTGVHDGGNVNVCDGVSDMCVCECDRNAHTNTYNTTT